MRIEKIEEIQSASSAIASRSSELLQLFLTPSEDGQPAYDATRVVLAAEISVAEAVARILTVDEGIQKIKKSEDQILVPRQHVANLRAAQSQLDQHLQNLSSQLTSAIASGGGLVAFNYDNFHLQTKNGQNLDFRAVFKHFVQHTDNLLEAYFNLLSVLRPNRATFSFQSAANALAKMLEQLSDGNSELFEQISITKKEAIRAEEFSKQARTMAVESDRLREEIQKERRSIAEYLAEVIEKKTAIDTVHSSATALKDEISEYQEEFESFDRQLKKRNAEFETGSNRQAKLFEKFENQSAEIGRLTSESEAMLKGATVAGLASSFERAHRELDTQLKWARSSFYFGIVFLFISAVPLMLYVFFPIVGPILRLQFPNLALDVASYSADESISGWQYFGQVLARFVILLPAAWFVSFSAIRHSSLFRLREHYAYKYSMAVAVEGFKKQAPDYAGEIAALVLEQLAFNPADKLVHSKDIPEGRVPHPMMELILKRMRSGLAPSKDQ